MDKNNKLDLRLREIKTIEISDNVSFYEFPITGRGVIANKVRKIRNENLTLQFFFQKVTNRSIGHEI